MEEADVLCNRIGKIRHYFVLICGRNNNGWNIEMFGQSDKVEEQIWRRIPSVYKLP